MVIYSTHRHVRPELPDARQCTPEFFCVATTESRSRGTDLPNSRGPIVSRQSALPRVAVILASTGRPETLAKAVEYFRRQSLSPSRIILSVVSPADLPPDEAMAGVEALTGPKGLPAQRNTGLRHLNGNADVIAFFDDDYIPSRFCIEQIARFFHAHPEVAGANGLLLDDGINSPGIAVAAAERLIADYDARHVSRLDVQRPLAGLYGCNMAYRSTATQGIWFDERLKLYGWQEDIDFAAQVALRGQIVKTNAFAGVHLGVKGGRTSGVRLGYSQVVNPIYLNRKGTMGMRFAARILLCNVIANHLRVLRPEPWVDRMGRARGNWLGLFDVLRGRVTPERIEVL